MPPLRFHPHLIETIIGGRSAIDLPRLEISDLDQAYKFANSYGFDLNDSDDLAEVWSLHRRSVALIKDELLNENEKIPAEVTDPAHLQDIGYLLVYASSKTQDSKSLELQAWACALLRVMHTFAHVENDIFTNYADQIQEQILKPIRDHMVIDPVVGTTIGLTTDIDQIPLYKFEAKPFKAKTSSVIKLLSKPQAVAFSLLDRMGVRFVTKSLLDAFRLVRLLHRENIVSFPNVMPDQSRNTLFPVNLLIEVLNESEKDLTHDKLNELLKSKLEESLHRAEFVEKHNEFSSQEYRSIKFIARKLIEVQTGDKHFHFFFPLEVQVVDYDNYVKILSGPGSHEEYKKRQRERARQRVLTAVGELPK